MLGKDTNSGRLLPFVVALAIAAVSVLLWRMTVEQQATALEARVAQQASDLRDVLRAELVSAMRAIERQAVRWGSLGGMPEDAWRQDSANYLQDYPALDAMEWVDENLVIQWVHPREGNELLPGRALGGDPDRRLAFDEAGRASSAVVSEPVTLANDEDGVYVLSPILAKSGPQGFIVGVMRFDSFFNRVMGSRAAGFHLELQYAGAPVGVRIPGERRWLEDFAQERTFVLNDRRWVLRVSPGENMLPPARRAGPHAVLLGGLLLALLFAVVLRLQQQVIASSVVVRLLSLAVVLNIIVLSGVGWVMFYMHRNYQVLAEQERRVGRLLNEVTQHAEGTVVTMHAAAAVAGGRWEPEYQTHRLKLVETMARLRDLLSTTSEYAPVLDELEQLQARQRELERQAWGHMRLGEQSAAQDVLNSPAYVGVVNQITELNENFGRRMLERTQREFGRAQDQIWALEALLLATLTILVIAWVSILSIVGRNLRARVLAESTLQESEERARLIVDSAKDSIIVTDANGHIVQWNQQAERVFGYSADEALGLSFANTMLDEQAAAETQEQMRQHLSEGRAPLLRKRLEFSGIRRSGHSFPLEMTVVPMRLRGGHVFSLFIRDISNRKRHEEEMKQLRTRLQSIIDSMPSIVVGVAPDGAVMFWNRQAELATGIEWVNALGLQFDTILPMLAGVTVEIREALSSGVAYRRERLTVEDGDSLFFDVMLYPLATQEVDGAVIRIDDITSRVLIEETMVQTEKMMSVGGLAAGMAHEINNPLGGILQAVQNLERRTSLELPKNAEVAQEVGITLEQLRDYFEKRGIYSFLRGIREDGTRAAKIVNDMLQYSRRSGSKFAPIDLHELIEMVLRLAENDYDLKKQYDFRRVEIIREFDPSLPAVRCEKLKMEQVLLNLIKNSAQAMAHGGATEQPSIWIRTRVEGINVVIEVEDNGPGMPETTRRRVFEPFFTTKEVGIGTGLGLSVSYFIVTKQHHGQMTVDSAPGDGTRFTIRLPIDGGIPAEQANETAEPPAG